MFIEIHENNLTAWADYRFSATALEIDSTYTHTFDNDYRIEGGIVYPPEAPYAQKRAAEYPPYTEYLDAQVKLASSDEITRVAGQEQLDAYFGACLAVKDKYPK